MKGENSFICDCAFPELDWHHRDRLGKVEVAFFFCKETSPLFGFCTGMITEACL